MTCAGDYPRGMRRPVACGALGLTVVATLSAVTVASAGPNVDRRVLPGTGIGKVQLGMTLEQVRRALGRPRAVIRRIDLPAGGRYIEYSWEVEGDRGPDTWTVGVRSATRGAKLRVVRVGTTVPSERTREGLGVGSRPRQIVRVYPNASCLVRGYDQPYKGQWVVVEHRDGGMTAFLLYGIGFGGKPPDHRVVEVLVQNSWFTQGAVGSCEPEWRRW
jgi:hypothetical protein